MCGPGELDGKVAVVTGGARGIGRAICEELAHLGTAVAVWDVLEDDAEKTAGEITAAYGVKTGAWKVDVTRAEEVTQAAKETASKFGSLDILVNNAGIIRDNLFLRMSEEEWDAVLNVNLKGAFLCTKAAARMMRKKGGKIVNIASVVGIMGNATQANYSASKAGLIGLTKTAARELARYNICVNAVAPGLIDTEMTRKLDEDRRKEMLKGVPLGKLGTVWDVAHAVGFFASPDADYVTGQVLTVCGGMVM